MTAAKCDVPCVGHRGLLFSHSSKVLPTEVTVIWHLAPSLREKQGHVPLSVERRRPEAESIQKHGRRKLIAPQWTQCNSSWSKQERSSPGGVWFICLIKPSKAMLGGSLPSAFMLVGSWQWLAALCSEGLAVSQLCSHPKRLSQLPGWYSDRFATLKARRSILLFCKIMSQGLQLPASSPHPTLSWPCLGWLP